MQPKRYFTLKSCSDTQNYIAIIYIQIAETLFQYEPEAFTIKGSKTQEEGTAAHLERLRIVGENEGLVFLRERK